MRKETEKEKEAKKHLNQRQIRFVQNYMKTNNITHSAMDAGYSKKTAHVQGCNLLKNPKIVAYIEAINERIESAKIADIEEVMEYLTAVMRGEKKDQFDLEASLSDRTRAAGELAKRLDVKAKTVNVDMAVSILDDIPDDMEIDNEED